MDLGAGRMRRCPARSIWTSAMLPLGVLHTSHYRLQKIGWDILPDPDVPPPVPCKKRSIQHRELCRCRCSRVALRRSTSFWGPTWREACLFVLTGFACRLKSPVEGVLGTNMVCPARMQPFCSAEYSQKCTVLPGGPVRAAKTMPMSLSASPFCCTDFSECRAR